MAKKSKRYTLLREKVDKLKYSTEEGFDTLVEISNSELKAKFVESVDVAVRLGVNPKYADQQVRGACPLPNGCCDSASISGDTPCNLLCC